jgi:hypothetical protein
MRDFPAVCSAFLFPAFQAKKNRVSRRRRLPAGRPVIAGAGLGNRWFVLRPPCAVDGQDGGAADNQEGKQDPIHCPLSEQFAVLLEKSSRDSNTPGRL